MVFPRPFSCGGMTPCFSLHRVHFAGTESATVWCGFMNGAIQAGFRASTEVQFVSSLPVYGINSTSLQLRAIDLFCIALTRELLQTVYVCFVLWRFRDKTANLKASQKRYAISRHRIGLCWNKHLANMLTGWRI